MMKKSILSLSMIALVAITCAGSASAQCAFNGIAKAKGFKTSMVRVFTGCPSSEHPSINTSTGGGTPACDPVTPTEFRGEATPYSFDPQTGGCDVQTKPKIEKDCSRLTDANGDVIGLPAGPCHMTYVKARCKGILDGNGTPINASQDAGWSLSILTRMTFDDATNGDMTVIDFPMTLPYEDPKNGQMKLDGTIPSYDMAIIPEYVFTVLPTCTTLQFIKLTIRDPEGRPFATMGGSTRAENN